MRTSYTTIAPEGEDTSGTTSTSDYSGIIVIKEPKAGERYDVINKLPISKLFLILMMVVYAISAYAKGKSGVSNHDLSMIISYSIFVIFAFIFLHISAYLYRGWAEKTLSEGILEGTVSFLKRYWFSIFCSIGLIFILFLNYVYIDKAVEKAINKSILLKEHYGK